MLRKTACINEPPPGFSGWIDKKKTCPRWLCRTDCERILSRLIYKKHYGIIRFNKGEQVNHKCGNSMCLNIEHLYLGTQRENMKDRQIAGRSNKGKTWKIPIEKIRFVKLTIQDTKEIKALYISGRYTQRELGKMYNVSQPRIVKILKQKE